jgi:hypothetical protein
LPNPAHPDGLYRYDTWPDYHDGVVRNGCDDLKSGAEERVEIRHSRKMIELDNLVNGTDRG